MPKPEDTEDGIAKSYRVRAEDVLKKRKDSHGDNIEEMRNKCVLACLEYGGPPAGSGVFGMLMQALQNQIENCPQTFANLDIELPADIWMDIIKASVAHGVSISVMIENALVQRGDFFHQAATHDTKIKIHKFKDGYSVKKVNRI